MRTRKNDTVNLWIPFTITFCAGMTLAAIIYLLIGGSYSVEGITQGTLVWLAIAGAVTWHYNKKNQGHEIKAFAGLGKLLLGVVAFITLILVLILISL